MKFSFFYHAVGVRPIIKPTTNDERAPYQEFLLKFQRSYKR